MTDKQIDLAIASKLNCLVKHIMQSENISDTEAFRELAHTKLFSIIKNKKSRMYIEPIEYVVHAYDLEHNESEEAMMNFIQLV